MLYQCWHSVRDAGTTLTCVGPVSCAPREVDSSHINTSAGPALAECFINQYGADPFGVSAGPCILYLLSCYDHPPFRSQGSLKINHLSCRKQSKQNMCSHNKLLVYRAV